MRSSIFFIAMTFLFLTSCKQSTETSATAADASAQPVDMEAVKAEIQALETAWGAAQSAKDINALMAMYTDDAISMADGSPSLKGKAAIQARQEEEFAKAPDGLSSTYTVEEVYGDGDIVTEIGSGVTKDASGAVVRTGKYMVVWKKVDGKYLCAREIYNSDMKEK